MHAAILLLFNYVLDHVTVQPQIQAEVRIAYLYLTHQRGGTCRGLKLPAVTPRQYAVKCGSVPAWMARNIHLYLPRLMVFTKYRKLPTFLLRFFFCTWHCLSLYRAVNLHFKLCINSPNLHASQSKHC